MKHRVLGILDKNPRNQKTRSTLTGNGDAFLKPRKYIEQKVCFVLDRLNFIYKYLL
jgi:hypothetical protein